MEKILKSVLSVLIAWMGLLAFGADDAIPLKNMWDTNRLYTAETVDRKIAQAVEGGDYNNLTNKPSIGGVVLEGNKTASALGLQPTISDYTTTGAVQNIVEGYGYATETAVAGALNGKQDKLPYATNAIPQGAVSGLSTAKWPLSNVTNENGFAVGAADVGALNAFDYVEGDVRNVLISTNDYSLPNGSRVVHEPSLVYSQNYSLSNIDSTRIDRLGGTEIYDSQKIGGEWVDSYTRITLGAISYGFGVEYSYGNDIYTIVSLPPNAQGYFAIEGWDSLSRTLNNTASNSTNKAACAEALKKITESEPHFAIIDGELHIISITETED